jgi:hypothetical protein
MAALHSGVLRAAEQCDAMTYDFARVRARHDDLNEQQGNAGALCKLEWVQGQQASQFWGLSAAMGSSVANDLVRAALGDSATWAVRNATIDAAPPSSAAAPRSAAVAQFQCDVGYSLPRHRYRSSQRNGHRLGCRAGRVHEAALLSAWCAPMLESKWQALERAAVTAGSGRSL